MNAESNEVDAEVFDPTGQGVEVVDAEFARKLARERDVARGRCLALEHDRAEAEGLVGALRGECSEARRGGDSTTQACQLAMLSELGLLDEFGRDVGPELCQKLGEELVATRQRGAKFAEAIVQAELSAEADHDEARVGRALNAELQTENSRLREIFPKVLEAMGHTEVCGSGAAVKFLENIPAIVREEFRQARMEGQRNESGGAVDARMLFRIDEEVFDHCESPDCTTLDAVRLMKCRLQELEAENTRREIYDSWRT
jgi:hypothetical protein